MVALAAFGAAVALAVALMPAAAMAAPAQPQSAASGDWTQFHNDAAHQGYNSAETTISASNVSGLGVAWTGTTGGQIGMSSPVIANGVVYIGSQDGTLYAYAVGCSTGGGSCTPLWRATTGAAIQSAPAVADGVVYVTSLDHKLYAFDAAGATQCLVLSRVKRCDPLWTATTGGEIWSSPTVANGSVFVTSHDGKLYAFSLTPATMLTVCSGTAPSRSCNPVWTANAGAATNVGIVASPTVANGGVYVASEDTKLYVFDAAGGSMTCAGTYPNKTCVAAWIANDGQMMTATPTVANGYVITIDILGTVNAYVADGTYAPCTGMLPAICPPAWYAGNYGWGDSSPAAANGVVYVSARDGNLYAFDIYGSAQHCLFNGVSSHCNPLWRSATTARLDSSPAIANGVVYVGSQDNKLYGYDAAGCSGTCAPIWTSQATGGFIDSSPAVSNGVVYVGSRDAKLYAFGLRGGATYHALTPTRILDSRDGTGGLSGAFSSHVARTFQVTGHGGVPAGATAVTGNLTVTQQTSQGFLSIGPIAANNPTSSTLNFPVGDDRANAVTVALSGTGSLSITYAAPTSGPTAHVIFDVTGYFTPDTSGATYHALTPARVLDSRDGTGLAGAFGSHVARTFTVTGHGGVPAGATAVTGNLTVTGQNSQGFLSVGPVAQNNPTSSTLNFPLGDDRANAVTVALGAGGTLSVTYAAPTAGPTAHAIFDVTGYFVP